jgi:hypothetical protein
LLATTLYQGNYDRNHKSGISYQLRDTYSIWRMMLEGCYIYMESSQWGNWNHLLS